jgi:hypothetical protein
MMFPLVVTTTWLYTTRDDPNHLGHDEMQLILNSKQTTMIYNWLQIRMADYKLEWLNKYNDWAHQITWNIHIFEIKHINPAIISW